MGEQNTQFKIYTDESNIPGHQRAWVWGMVAMAILLCGLAAGWLLSHGGFGASGPLRASSNASAVSVAEATEWLAQQETANRQLQERIGKLERALADNDSCGPAALEALGLKSGKL